MYEDLKRIKIKMFTGKGEPITEIKDEEKQTLINILFVTLDNVIIRVKTYLIVVF